MNQQRVTHREWRTSVPGAQDWSRPSAVTLPLSLLTYLRLQPDTVGDKAGLKRDRRNLSSINGSRNHLTPFQKGGGLMGKWCNLRCLFSVLSSGLECANQDDNTGCYLLELSSRSSVARHRAGAMWKWSLDGGYSCFLIFSRSSLATNTLHAGGADHARDSLPSRSSSLEGAGMPGCGGSVERSQTGDMRWDRLWLLFLLRSDSRLQDHSHLL